MDKLPQLDIEADLNNLESDGEENVSIVVEDLTGDSFPKTEPQDIFVGKPTNGKTKRPAPQNIKKKVVSKSEVEIPEPLQEVTDQPEEEEEKPKKKPLSEKQRLHLEKIRAKALEAKKEKMRLKKEVKERVEVEVKKTRQRKKKEVAEDKGLSEDFKQRMKVPSDEEIQAKKKKDEEMSFINFMSNMEKYQFMRHQFEQEKQARQPPPPKPQPPAQPVQRSQPQPTPKPQRKPAPQKLPETIKPKQQNPYDELFQW